MSWMDGALGIFKQIQHICIELPSTDTNYIHTVTGVGYRDKIIIYTNECPYIKQF